MIWNPEGYLPWNSVLCEFVCRTEKLIALACLLKENDEDKVARLLQEPSELLISRGAAELLKKHGFARDEKEARLVIRLVTLWLFCIFIEVFPPIVASVDGRRFCLSHTFFLHRDELVLCRMDWPLQEMSEFSRFFQYAEEGNFDADQLVRRFIFVESPTGRLAIQNGAHEFLEQNVSEFEMSEVMQLANELKGFHVFWRDEPRREDLATLFGVLSDVDFFAQAVKRLYPKVSGGTGKIVTKIADETRAEQEARRILLQDQGQTFRSGSLRRALSVEVGERPWSRIVSKLREDFPHISRAGAPKNLDGESKHQ